MFSGPEACLTGCMRFRHQIHQIGANQEAHLIGFSGPWIWIQKNVHIGKCLRHRVYIGDFDCTNLGLVLLFPTRTEGCILWCPRMSWRNLLHGISNSWLNQTFQRKFSEGACLANMQVYDGVCAFVADIQRWMCCCLHLWIHSYSWFSLHVVVAQLPNKSVLAVFWGWTHQICSNLKTPASVRDYLKQYHGANKLQRVANWRKYLLLHLNQSGWYCITPWFSLRSLMVKQIWEHNKKDMNNIWTTYEHLNMNIIWKQYEHMKENEKMTHAYFFSLWEAGPDGS